MTATEKLRRLLDERGIEYYPKRADETVWTASNNVAHVWTCNDIIDGYLEIHMRPITPEQAVEATLGKGTCRRVLYKPTGVLVCSECGAGIPKQLDKYCFLHFCPNCGARVVNE